MVSKWFPLPSQLLMDLAEPYLLSGSRLDEFRDYISSVQASSVTISLDDTRSASDVIDSFKSVLKFPDWCGSSWDSIEDSFEEIRQETDFPMVVIIHGLKALTETRPHLAFEVVLRLSELSQAFSAVGDQFMAVYVDNDWV